VQRQHDLMAGSPTYTSAVPAPNLDGKARFESQLPHLKTVVTLRAYVDCPTDTNATSRYRSPAAKEGGRPGRRSRCVA